MCSKYDSSVDGDLGAVLQVLVAPLAFVQSTKHSVRLCPSVVDFLSTLASGEMVHPGK